MTQAPQYDDPTGARIRELIRERDGALAADRFDRVEHIDDELARLGVLRVPAPGPAELAPPIPRPGS